MPSRAHVLTLLHTRDDDDALAHPCACPPPYTTTTTTTPSTALPSLPCEGTEAIVQCTPLCVLCLCFCSPHLCPPSLLMPMCIPTADNNNNNNASSSSSSLPSLRAQQHDDNDDAVALVRQCRHHRHRHPHPCPRIAAMMATHTVPVGIPVLGYTLG